MRRCTEQGEFNWSPHHHHRWSYRGAVRSQKIRDSDGLLCGLHTHSEPIVQFQVMSSMNGSHHGMSEHHQKFMTRICMNEAELWHETNPTIPYLLRCDTLDRHQVNTTRDHLCSVIFSVLCVVALPANDALHLRFLCGDCFYQPQPPKTLCQESESCLTWLEVESLSCCSTEKQTRHFIYTKLSRSATLRSTSWASHLNCVLICPVPVCPWGERDTLALLSFDTLHCDSEHVFGGLRGRSGRGTTSATAAESANLYVFIWQSVVKLSDVMWWQQSDVCDASVSQLAATGWGQLLISGYCAKKGKTRLRFHEKGRKYTVRRNALCLFVWMTARRGKYVMRLQGWAATTTPSAVFFLHSLRDAGACSGRSRACFELCCQWGSSCDRSRGASGGVAFTREQQHSMQVDSIKPDQSTDLLCYRDCLHSDNDANAPIVGPHPKCLAQALR